MALDEKRNNVVTTDDVMKARRAKRIHENMEAQVAWAKAILARADEAGIDIDKIAPASNPDAATPFGEG